jgi:hypothetical protein
MATRFLTAILFENRRAGRYLLDCLIDSFEPVTFVVFHERAPVMFRNLVAICLLLASAASAQANTIAITEIFENPIGERNGRTWIELFNYGSAPVNLTSWKLIDENEQQCDLPEYTIKPGEYIIMVFGSRAVPGIDKKHIFEKEWLGGKESDQVFGVTNAVFDLNTTDQVTVRNNRRKVIWSVSWKNDGKAGRASWFASDKYLPTSYGSKANPGIVRKGNDAGIAGGDLPGYEINDLTPDPDAYESDPSGLEGEFGPLFATIAKDGKCDKGVGSPLKGKHKVAGAK